jgi:ribose 5-phosphate isomerase B
MASVYIGADHRGFKLKEKIKGWLSTWGYECQDLGNDKYENEDDFVDFAIDLAEKVSSRKNKGILICGSGVGMSIAANKVKGIRAALCTSEKQTRLAREEDNANVLCLSADFVDEETNQKIIETFLETIFSGDERYFRRLNKIKSYESKTD